MNITMEPYQLKSLFEQWHRWYSDVLAISCVFVPDQMDPEHTWTNAAAVNWALKVIYNPVWCSVGAAERVGGQVVITGSTLHDVEASIRLLNPQISHTELQVFL